MRITILIITVLFSVACFGQGSSKMINVGDTLYNRKAKPSTDIKVDTLNIPLLSIKESQSFILSINNKLNAMRELNLIQEREFAELYKELTRIWAIIEEKKKTIK